MTATLKTNASGQNEQGEPRETSPLRPERQQTSYGASSAVLPLPPGPQSPPPCPAAQDSSDGERQETHADRFPWHQPLSFPPNHAKRLITWTTIFLIVSAQFAAFVLCNNKIGRYNEAVAQMREQQDTTRKEAEHMENERIALGRESTRLENERIAFSRESARLEEERKRWEKVRDELTIPKGAFWETILPAWDCRAYGKREYWGTLRNVPEGRSEMDACMNMPVEIRGATIRRPYRCQHRGGSMNGFWMVDWEQPDCKPWHQEFVDKGCTNKGSGLRHIEAEVVGINNKGEQDWRLLCETTPMVWDHINYTSPAHCDDRGRKIAVWYVLDDKC